MTPHPATPALEALIRQWRTDARFHESQDSHIDMRQALVMSLLFCADELEAALASVPPPPDGGES